MTESCLNLIRSPRLEFSIARIQDPASGVQRSEEALEFICVLAVAAAKGCAQEVQWLTDHTPTEYSPYLQQGANLALFAAILGGHHAVCQILLEWYNPSKAPMQLPMCKYTWTPSWGRDAVDSDVSFLALAYEWRTIQGKKMSSRGYFGRFEDFERQPSSQYLGLLRLLLDYNASLASGAQGLLQAIAWSADVTAIQQLLQHGLNANAALSDGNTLLHLLVTWDSGFPERLWPTGTRSATSKPSVPKEKQAQDWGKHVEPAVLAVLQASGSPTEVYNTMRKTPLDECCPHFGNIKALMLNTLQPRNVALSQNAASSSPTCSICMDQPSIMVLVPCGHLCLCQQCAYAQQRCPICRATVAQMVRTYIS